MFKLEDGIKAVRIARIEIEAHLGRKPSNDVADPPVFDKNSGVFVTLNTYPSKNLRGCIGYPEPVMPLGRALRNVAVGAATGDPRFPPVRLSEMDSIVVEVTLLTPPQKIRYSDIDELVSRIKIGRDGLIASKSRFSGLLLPQVPVEYNWSVEDFLSHTCMKAGLHPEEWRRGDVEFQSFSGKLFAETSPRGEIEEVPLS
ncbi:MAG: TIGR00296 family protein [Thermoplasmatota archaeon]